MSTGLNIRQDGALDFLSLGALIHRLDPGIIPFRKATECKIHVSGGEFNCAANLSDCFGLKTGVASAMVDYPVGALIAERLGATFIDGDLLHPKANVAKMESGTPLNDEDRKPWLETIARKSGGWWGQERAAMRSAYSGLARPRASRRRASFAAGVRTARVRSVKRSTTSRRILLGSVNR